MFWKVKGNAKGRLLCCSASPATRSFQCLERVIFLEQQALCWYMWLVVFAYCHLLWDNDFPSSDKSGRVFPFRSVDPKVQLPCMKLESDGVITLNEPYKTLVPTSLYHCHGINRLVIPTRDYCFAPSLNDTCCAADFIHDTNDLSHKTVEAGYTHPVSF
ncbi:unnamed protein product [Prunus armeniaca]|uniref:Uncharacterized protein n=1 Tax=Prunus armeniaca TaxID=36596 RepID=A0A6J5X589_PRUAR|nr:unnamed protein product [Prunus armeniaca]